MKFRKKKAKLGIHGVIELVLSLILIKMMCPIDAYTFFIYEPYIDISWLFDEKFKIINIVGLFN